MRLRGKEKSNEINIDVDMKRTCHTYFMETVGLRKAYKDNIVVDDVNMHISKGAIYGFVGPNGAGKSTVMKMILSLIQPDAGEVQLLGEKVTSHS